MMPRSLPPGHQASAPLRRDAAPGRRAADHRLVSVPL